VEHPQTIVQHVFGVEHAHIGPGWTDIPGINTLAYQASLLATKIKHLCNFKETNVIVLVTDG
jgi:hypothetical protein